MVGRQSYGREAKLWKDGRAMVVRQSYGREAELW